MNLKQALPSLILPVAIYVVMPLALVLALPVFISSADLVQAIRSLLPVAAAGGAVLFLLLLLAAVKEEMSFHLLFYAAVLVQAFLLLPGGGLQAYMLDVGGDLWPLFLAVAAIAGISIIRLASGKAAVKAGLASLRAVSAVFLFLPLGLILSLPGGDLPWQVIPALLVFSLASSLLAFVYGASPKGSRRRLLAGEGAVIAAGLLPIAVLETASFVLQLQGISIQGSAAGLGLLVSCSILIWMAYPLVEHLLFRGEKGSAAP
jgi:hypothetical protein